MLMFFVILVLFIYLNSFLFKNSFFFKVNIDKNIYMFIYLITFIYFFVYLLRYLSFFRQKNPIDLAFLLIKLVDFGLINIILIVLIIIQIRKLLFNFIKFYLLSYHFSLLSYNNKIYYYIYFFLKNWPFFFIKKFRIINKYRLFLFYFFKYFFTVLILTLFLLECYYNDLVILLILKYIPLYGIYMMLYNLNFFIIFKSEINFDIRVSNFYYKKKDKKILDHNEAYLIFLYVKKKLFN